MNERNQKLEFLKQWEQCDARISNAESWRKSRTLFVNALRA